MALSIDINWRSVDDHGAERLDIDCRGLDRYAGLLEQDLAGTDLEFDANVGGHGDGLLDVDRLILGYLDVLASVLNIELVVTIFQRCVARSATPESFADGAGFRMADNQLIILLGVQPDFFRILLILEIPFVIAAAALGGGIRLDSRDGLFVGKLVGRLVFLVIYGADHQRTIGVAFEEFDDGFLAYARYELPAPA